MNKLRLIPTVDVGKLGHHYYLYDRIAGDAQIIYVPTQKVSAQLARVVSLIKQYWPGGVAHTLEELQSRFEQAADQKRLSTLLSAGYFEPVVEDVSTAATLESRPPGERTPGERTEIITAQTRYPSTTEQLTHFRQNVVKHYLRKPSFFNLPAQVETSGAHIGLVGVPIASIPDSVGTQFGPDRLRQSSQSAGFWFDIYRDGVYSEVGCDNSAASVICQDIVLKDFGDLGGSSRTIGELFAEAQKLVAEELVPNGIRPLFIGGDHAITFPLVDAYLKHYPSLVLLHLDAHNDLFYTEKVEFNHAGPMHGLFVHSGLSALHSFGLRTNADPRVRAFRAHSQPDENGEVLADRAQLHSIGATKRLLNTSGALQTHLMNTISSDTPVYLTIDLDVLSEQAMGAQLSTPAGHGLEFHELLEFVQTASQCLNIVAADLVEFNVRGDNSSSAVIKNVTTTLLHIVDGLFQSGLRHGMLRVKPEEKQAVQAPKPVDQQAVPRLSLPVDSAIPTPTLKLQPLERRSLHDLDYKTFVNDYILPGKPLILTGAVDDHKIQQWDLDYFLQRINRHEQIKVSLFPEQFQHQLVKSGQMSLWDALSTMRRRQRVELAENDERYNIVDWDFGTKNPELFDDVPELPFFTMDISSTVYGEEHVLKWIYFGEPGTGTKTHIDVLNSNAWLLLACGKKAWRMVHESYEKQCCDGNGMVDLFAPDSARFSEIAEVPIWEGVQQPGEIVWTPNRCIHAVRNLEFSIAMTQNYIDLTNLNNVIDPLLNSLQNPAADKSYPCTITDLVGQARRRFEEEGHGELAPLFLDPIKDKLDQHHQRLESRRQDLQLTADYIGSLI